nr:pyrophosphate--fructose 6-phosphate 1-phosphotransferase subunit alpha [Ipomoea trifida]
MTQSPPLRKCVRFAKHGPEGSRKESASPSPRRKAVFPISINCSPKNEFSRNPFRYLSILSVLALQSFVSCRCAMVGNGGIPGEQNIDFDWNRLLDDDNFLFAAVDEGFSNLSPDSLPLSIGDIEEILMKDDDAAPYDFISEILLDSPAEASAPSGEVAGIEESDHSGEVVGTPDTKGSSGSEVEDDGKGKERDTVEGVEQQLRNRDAAVRSRERKKTYVRDLELKSKYYESECRRLGIMLQYCLAENQTLRLSLQNSKAVGASMPMQESAVLLLESLLLGSLHWFLGITCLLILLPLLQSTPLRVVPQEGQENKNQASLAPGKVGSRTNRIWVIQSKMGKRYKASRSRMKSTSVLAQVPTVWVLVTEYVKESRKCFDTVAAEFSSDSHCESERVPSGEKGQVKMDSDFGLARELSDLQKLRSQYRPELPPCLQGTAVRVEFGDATTAADPSGGHTISRLFPHTFGQPLAHFLRASAKVPDAQIITEHPSIRVGIVFCGRQSPGGHNAIWGLYDAIKVHNPNSTLLGFLGMLCMHIAKADYNDAFRGYDLLGRTKDQIRSTEQVNAALTACTSLKLDGLVIVGGIHDMLLIWQKAFAEAKCPTKVVGVPVTLNGDLKNQFVETNVGFDTICKVNSQLISNVCTDALSAEKVILAEEISCPDKYHGVILLPEGLIESIPEVYALLKEIHGLLRQGVSADNIFSQLSPWASALFEFMPPFIRKQLLLHPESDDSAQLSQIETEKLLAFLVEEEMNKRTKEGKYKGKKFNAICHFFGYQARGSLPSKFDCDYAYVLGHVCYHILAAGLNGYLATLTNLKNPVNKWRCGAAPITAMMTVRRYGHGPAADSFGKPALHPATVDLRGKAYELLRQNATKFLLDDVYRNPGPLQFDGPGADAKALTLCVEDQDYMGRIKELQEYLDKGCSQDVLKAALSAMASVTNILSVMSNGGAEQVGYGVERPFTPGVEEVYSVICEVNCCNILSKEQIL